MILAFYATYWWGPTWGRCQMSDKKFLEFRGDSFRFVRRIGEKREQKYLGTNSLSQARKLRDRYLALGTWQSHDIAELLDCSAKRWTKSPQGRSLVSLYYLKKSILTLNWSTALKGLKFLVDLTKETIPSSKNLMIGTMTRERAQSSRKERARIIVQPSRVLWHGSELGISAHS